MFHYFSIKNTLRSNIERTIAGFVIAMLLVFSSPLALMAEEGASTTPQGTSTQTLIDDDQDDDTENEEGGDGGNGSNEATTTIQTGGAFAGNDIENEVNTNETDTNGTTTATSTQESGTSTDQTNGTSTASTTDSEGNGVGTGTVTASSTNDAIVDNTGTTTAGTGDNTASSTGDAVISTGDALSILNLINLINTNIYNSSGLLHLVNMLHGEDRFDLRDLDFEAFSQGSLDSNFFKNGSSTCSLTDCDDENIYHSITHNNSATVTNSQLVRSSTGGNTATGNNAYIQTGNAHSIANVHNLVNTNIVDSNYILLTVNNIGDYIGDIVLPSAQFFKQFFARMSGISGGTTINNTNNTEVVNNVSVNAGTGNNNATSSDGTAAVQTGDACAIANVSNDINQNHIGGSSVNMLIKVAGNWSGDIFGLPEGLTWEETPEGVRIYSAEAEGDDEVENSTNTASTTGPGGGLSVNSTNTAYVNNNIQVTALTGDNKVSGKGDAAIKTGDACAIANVQNTVGTNIVGMNWMSGLFNILGNFEGNISFGMPDIWLGGQVSSPDSPIKAGSPVTYTYTLVNNGDAPVTDIVLTNEYNTGLLSFDEDEEYGWNVGDLGPGESKEVTYTARVDSGLPSMQEVPIEVQTTATGRETDADETDNTESLLFSAVNPGARSSSGGSGNSDDDPRYLPDLSVVKTMEYNSEIDGAIDYTVTVMNDRDAAYHGVLYDTITDPHGEIVNEQVWDLGTIYPGEEIIITYTVEFNGSAISGIYENTAHLEAYRYPSKVGGPIDVSDASASAEIDGADLTISDVEVASTYVLEENAGGAVIEWKTNAPADSRVVFGLADGTYEVDEDDTAFGYPQSSPLDEEFVTEHGVLLSGLTPGESYAFRVVSEDGYNTAVSDEGEFTMPENTLLSNFDTQNAEAAAEDGDVLGTATGPTTTNMEVTRSSDENVTNTASGTQFASAVLGLGPLPDLTALCILQFLIIVLLVFFAWSILDDVVWHFQGNNRKRFFSHNTIFTSVFLVVLVALWMSESLAQVWPLMAALLGVWIVRDIRLDRMPPSDDDLRQRFYIGSLVAIAILAALTAHTCIIAPLVVVALGVFIWKLVSTGKLQKLIKR